MADSNNPYAPGLEFSPPAELVAASRLTSRSCFCLAALPAVGMLFMYYSLAIHMFFSLGGWPDYIGERGFRPELVVHARLAALGFTALVFSCLSWPFALLLCAVVPRWYALTKYLFVFLLSNFACFFLMQGAPAAFRYWWWD